MPNTSHIRNALVALTLVALSTAACARDTTSSGSEATDTGTVTIACGATEQWCAAMAKGFEQANNGVKANFVRLSSGEALARITAGKTNPEFDVWHGGPADGYAAAAEQALLEPYRSPNAAAIPDQFKDAGGHWTGVYAGAIGFCSNTKVLAEKGLKAPQSWQDLLNPALAKNVAIAHPSTSGTAYTALWTQVTLAGGNQDTALQYMRKLHPNVLQYTKSGTGPAQMVARGEVAVGVLFAHDCVAAKEEGFKDLEITFPSESTGYEVGGLGLIKGARNPVTAKKYIDWALTAPAQEIGATVKAYQVPTNPAAKRAPQVVDLTSVRLVNYDVLQAGAAKKALTARFDAEVAQAPKS
ncbi:ABC transporter substrate-binding protein [Catellatospora citrea]|uniref:Iron ABC transporter substrate-binding protein n=1 Tax=Catellatospora citrea TaxID=53366 RepID=A0A8J3P2F1_9ACTN|nr:ABC transporter substrate-binding protein [Catellatospora citrea]RKE10694.1 iron(III) transport system substrate-binding protein [Catellatospora citrea]GIG01173.1 iron ABC transporter substrate-binding protein [Catellatospora citrea]